MLPVLRSTIEASDLFNACCAGIRSAARKDRLVPNAQKVAMASTDYAAAGAAGTIHSLAASTYQPYGEATQDDFVWLYERRLVAHATCRVHYELLRNQNRGGRCALCNVRIAASLDHHLPKTVHPIFAVSPDNLLPACGECNKKKLSSMTPTLNPYFDDLGRGRWLQARVVPLSPAVINFFLLPSATWTPELTSRAQAHFELFQLAEVYAHEASRQLSGIRHRLAGLLESQGADGVRDHLLAEAESWTQAEPNSWESALYDALAHSDWFYSGGFSG